MDFHSKITISNYSDIRSVYHSNYLNTKFHIRFSSNGYIQRGKLSSNSLTTSKIILIKNGTIWSKTCFNFNHALYRYFSL